VPRDWRLAAIILGTLAVTAASGEEAGYAKPEACAGSHRGVWETYRRTGMARSFNRPSSANTVEDYSNKNTFYHKASDSYFSMLRRDGKFYQRRYQIDFAGKQVNVMEEQTDFIIGSGNHAGAARSSKCRLPGMRKREATGR
jgi:hypothetical protein